MTQTNGAGAEVWLTYNLRFEESRPTAGKVQLRHFIYGDLDLGLVIPTIGGSAD